jgi:hypothetical protein
VLDALDDVARNRPLIEQKRDREAANPCARDLDAPTRASSDCSTRSLSYLRLASRLQAQRHDPILAVDVGLLAVSDARAFSLAIAQALPVLMRDSEDLTVHGSIAVLDWSDD